MSGAIRYTPLRDRARGRWPGILIGIGIDPRYLTGKHGPCPFCGGKDRWRFTDFNSDGLWICNQCGSGSGTDLVMRFLGLPFRDAAHRIEEVIGAEPTALPKPKRDEKRIRAQLERLWSEAWAVRRGDPVDQWLRYRGVGLDLYPQTLRSADWLPYYDGPKITRWPAMLALVSAPDGRPASIHRTYLTKQGFKAPVPKPRKLYSSIAPGSAIRLTPPRATLGIAEGIETALSTARLFGIPTWSVICAHGIETFEPPPQITSLIIFGDNDANGVGQKAAHALAARLADRIRVDVLIPDQPDTDWNDELVAGMEIA
jgi:putative DNA primase/helicase